MRKKRIIEYKPKEDNQYKLLIFLSNVKLKDNKGGHVQKCAISNK